MFTLILHCTKKLSSYLSIDPVTFYNNRNAVALKQKENKSTFIQITNLYNILMTNIDVPVKLYVM